MTQYDLIPENSVLKALRVDGWKIRAALAFVTISVLGGVTGSFVTQLIFEIDSWRSPYLYLLGLLGFCHITTFSYVVTYVIALSFYVVLPLLKLTVHQFEEATKMMDAIKLKVSTTQIR